MTRLPATSDTASLKTRAPRATAILPSEIHTEATKPLSRNRHPAGASRFAARALTNPADLANRKREDSDASENLRHKKIQSPLSDWIFWGLLVGTE